ncbi:acetyl/propionyl-CoA carboxylase alpha subunit/acetyl-CoA carboxylase carboxyltransferase component [Actinoplanes octamycinicus]|uniref:Acetyl/propionyl-CoA carboxylase alpha subunit/acetyl-CoA carboxylase carboxyltransferase component n=1 Tax=Actinoplanes octamycinicus TaxID=135948 RepID=A0A7W7MAD5_9ACTN|nr:carboxyl transferase domain-containing protein [Actinoplanes octamycinicus]MBB4742816.1 acetyl/propionyl-CoA carboxylase alpha subunit/acetyl-CoA carboxylase carboxyltransferase component [Actinoplanes octamycinicus]GIE58330.1 fused acetyl/propionyl-CoA carboxylase subuit alpha/methylmalonyl-CoA decarboxylase subunit alpha [Actinoplanes octamycinicus]
MPATIHRLAIVNRGEAAIRALTAVQELNRAGDRPPITTIALWTDPDEHAWFVREADEAVALGPATYLDPDSGHRQSAYLDEPAVLAAVQAAGADTVWVGWGFLAERASFAERCEQAGITFVGPSAATIRLLGDKVAAKRLAQSAHVPVVPWSGEPVENLDQARGHATRLGYSLVLKAAAGGGGRGIRLIRAEADLAVALRSARDEAALAFGDPTVFLERLVPAARHVEVQVIADSYGTAWAVGVRDCTLQRRHQKVIEESASTVLNPGTEEAIRDAAVRVVTATGYLGAGTVEFLVDPDTGHFLFMEVNTRLQVEHPVTEATTGLDLVKLQLHVASGGRLTGNPPPVRGHAVEARLCAEDPENDFAPAPGRLARLVLPAGSGIRVDSGVREGDRIPADFDSMIAKIVAWGADRTEALSRLRRALAQTTAVIEGGTTNRSFLLHLLDRPQVRAGDFDNHWLDRLTGAGGHLPAADPVALLVAAVTAYDADEADERVAFLARAARGGVEAPPGTGHRCRLTYRGHRYDLHVYRTGPVTYRVVAADGAADLGLAGQGGPENRVTVAGRTHRCLTTVEGATIRVDLDGIAHTVSRDDGGVVRCAGPAFVVALRVAPGDTVVAGQPVAVLESMKMESTLAAPFGGTVVAVEVAENAQVEAGAAIVRITASETRTSGDAATVQLTGLTAAPPPGTPPCDRVYQALRGYLLGYDLDPATLREMLTRQRRLGEVSPPADPGLLRCEDGLIDLFADIGALYQPRESADADPDDPAAAGSGREHLNAYLQWLDADRAGLPFDYRERLTRALRRYRVDGLARTPALDQAMVLLARSLHRVDEVVPAVLAILDRRLHHRAALVPLTDDDTRARLDRLAAATRSHRPVVADLVREVRFRFVDEPLLAAAVAEEYTRAREHLDALHAEPGRADRAERVAGLIACPQPLHGTLVHAWRDHADPALHQALLEVFTRRYYRVAQLTGLRFAEVGGHQVCVADCSEGYRLITAFLPVADLPRLARAVVADRVADPEPAVLDVAAWRDEPDSGEDEVVAELDKMLAETGPGPGLRGLNVAVTGADGRRVNVSYRPGDAGLTEDPRYRNLHPMFAARLELWRLGNFRLRRLPSEAEDVYLFDAVAHDNPADHRLFALAEVRDLTVARDADGSARYPRLELIGLLSLSAIRAARAALPERQRPVSRLVLYVQPPWDLTPAAWPGLARSLTPLSAGAGLDKVVLRVRLPEGRDTVLHVEAFGNDVTVRERPPGREAIRPLTPYRQKLLRARRLGAPYPYEIVRMLTPPVGAVARFPHGRFTEYDLDQESRLAAVSRPYGLNTANIVTGVLASDTTKVPEGMERVIVLGDPTRGLGNLAEPECRRIIAALDLAERRGLPVEWFALSSGARIAMDSGTENMDWIAAVLRRLIEFTQAGGEVNVVVTGINVGAQPYWNAEATMLMHTRGILIMTPASAMVLTGKQALDFSGGVSAEDNFGIGGFDRIMGPNGQAQYWAADLAQACEILLRHYEHTYVVPGESGPRRRHTTDPADRDVRTAPHRGLPDSDLRTVGDIFSAGRNPERKKPFDMRSVLRAVADTDAEPLERWAHWRGAETGIVWDAHLGGIPVCLLGIESHPVPRRGFVPAGGPAAWTSGTLFPQSSRKLARAINAASGNRPLVVLANLSGFDGSPESMRRWQLEYGAEIGRAVTNFRGPVVFVVVSRYHGGAFVVFSKRLNERMEIAAVEGSFASVIGGAPAAATVFAREVRHRTDQDPRVREAAERLRAAGGSEAGKRRAHLAEITAAVRSAQLGQVADEFDAVHTVRRAVAVGSVDRIIPAAELRPYLIDAVERGLSAAAG